MKLPAKRICRRNVIRISWNNNILFRIYIKQFIMTLRNTMNNLDSVKEKN